MEETTLHRRRVYNGRLVKVDLLDVRLPDGSQGIREIVQHPGAVAVVAQDANGHILLVRQFRIAAGRLMLEIPAGTLNPGEAPEDCAAREMQEETGYKPAHLEALGGFFVAPGYTTEYIHLFCATGLSESRLDGDTDEFIELVRLPLDEALSLIERGDLIDSKTIIGLLRFARRTA